MEDNLWKSQNFNMLKMIKTQQWAHDRMGMDIYGI